MVCPKISFSGGFVISDGNFYRPPCFASFKKVNNFGLPVCFLVLSDLI